MPIAADPQTAALRPAGDLFAAPPAPSLSDLFPVVLSRLPRAARAQAGRWSALSRACTLETFGCFELGLGGHEAPLFDFSIRLKKPREAEALEAAGLVSADLARVVENWRASTEEADPITSLWVEYDLHRWVDGPPAPIFFTQFGLHVGSERILAEFLPLLFGRALPAGHRRKLEQVFTELPEGARLLYLSSLAGRGVEGVRFEFIDLEIERVTPYLERLGSGDWQALVDAAAPFHQGNEQFHLSFDVTDRLEPRLGFQSSFRKQPAREPRWEETFVRLERAGLCTAEERRLMLAWPGIDTAATAGGDWPADDGRPLRGCCFRALSHIKVVSRPDRPLEAKAYLLFGHMPPRPAPAG